MQAAIEAISHPGRRAMLRLVLDRELPVGELAEHAGLSQPAASQHLKVLRDAGLVRGRVDGRRRLYRVDPDGVEQLTIRDGMIASSVFVTDMAAFGAFVAP